MDWDAKFPLSSDIGASLVKPNKKFRFEKWWLERRVKQFVTKAWSTPFSEENPIDIW
jgi:hypothetical protein